MAVKTITVLDPTARTAPRHIPVAPAIHDLKGKVIGLLWNRKANGDLLLRRIAEQLSRSFHLRGTVWQQKASGAVPAGGAAIEELARNCDLVINAVGD